MGDRSHFAFALGLFELNTGAASRITNENGGAVAMATATKGNRNTSDMLLLYCVYVMDLSLLICVLYQHMQQFNAKT
jgi:hypothetical protein